MTAAPVVSVVVPARDSAATLGATLDAIGGRHDGPAAEVIVVDNGSLDDTAAIAEAHPTVDWVVRRRRGEGAGAARNAGAAVAGGEILAFTDADCEPEPDWLESGVRALRAKGFDLMQGPVLPAGEKGPWDRSLWVTAAWGLFESANLFVRRDLFEGLGGFPSGLELPAGDSGGEAPFGEDALFGWAARRAGARTGFCQEALVRHAVFPRGAREYVAERRRVRFFPALVRQVPELRRSFLHRRLFLTPRSARFDAALTALLPVRGIPPPVRLALALPYLRLLYRDVRTWSGRAGLGEVVATSVAADAVTAGTLAQASVQARTPVL